MLKRADLGKHKKNCGRVDYPLLSGVTLLLIFGILMVYDASVVYATSVFGGKYHFLFLQAGWVLIGLVFLAVTTNFDYHHLPRLAKPLLFLSLFFLFLLAWPNLPLLEKLVPQSLYDLFIPQITVLRAYRWIIINPSPLPSLPFVDRLSFQPTDLAKIALVIFLASWLADLRQKVEWRWGTANRFSFSVYLKFFVLFLITVSLVVLEPDFGTATILAVTILGIYFLAGAPLLLFVFSLLLSLGGALLAILLSPYRRERLLSFLDHTGVDPLSAGYHLQQALIALGSGGWTGLGLGQSRQKYGYLPEAATDSIFAVVGEELGFLGVVVVLLLFLFIFWRGLQVSQHSPDELGRLLSAGIVAWLTAQTLINIAAMTSLIPLTGVTLPFLSYGGSSLVATLAAVGILLNISRWAREVKGK